MNLATGQEMREAFGLITSDCIFVMQILKQFPNLKQRFPSSRQLGGDDECLGSDTCALSLGRWKSMGVVLGWATNGCGVRNALQRTGKRKTLPLAQLGLQTEAELDLFHTRPK